MLAGKSYLITGAASGIGAATARQLARAGARLALWDVNAEALTALAAELGAFSQGVDITSAANVASAMQASTGHLGGLDGCIHCAGILYTGAFETLDLERQRRLIDTNLYGTCVVAQSAIPHLRASRGSLILMASISGFYGSPEFATYAASKAGVISLGQALRIELADSGIHIGIVPPFFVNTPMTEQAIGTRLFTGRFAHQPDDIAQTILQGLRQRSFMLLPSFQVRLVYWLSHYGHALMHPFVGFNWRNSRGSAAK